jgi:hypothetical protein
MSVRSELRAPGSARARTECRVSDSSPSTHQCLPSVTDVTFHSCSFDICNALAFAAAAAPRQRARSGPGPAPVRPRRRVRTRRVTPDHGAFGAPAHRGWRGHRHGDVVHNAKLYGSDSDSRVTLVALSTLLSLLLPPR